MHGRATLYCLNRPPWNAIYKNGALVKKERVAADKVYFPKNGVIIAATNDEKGKTEVPTTPNKPKGNPDLPPVANNPEAVAPAPGIQPPTPVTDGKKSQCCLLF